LDVLCILLQLTRIKEVHIKTIRNLTTKSYQRSHLFVEKSQEKFSGSRNLNILEKRVTSCKWRLQANCYEDKLTFLNKMKA
jgi:hypothetical protein